MLRFNLLAKLLGHGVPHEKIHPERQVAFLERFPEIGNPPVLLWRCENHQIQIGLRARGPFGARAIDPGCRVWQMPFKQVRNDRNRVRCRYGPQPRAILHPSSGNLLQALFLNQLQKLKAPAGCFSPRSACQIRPVETFRYKANTA